MERATLLATDRFAVLGDREETLVANQILNRNADVVGIGGDDRGFGNAGFNADSIKQLGDGDAAKFGESFGAATIGALTLDGGGGLLGEGGPVEGEGLGGLALEGELPILAEVGDVGLGEPIVFGDRGLVLLGEGGLADGGLATGEEESEG